MAASTPVAAFGIDADIEIGHGANRGLECVEND